MDNLTPVRSFLKELITPIVKDAVRSAISVQTSSATKHHIPVKEAERLYGISSSNIYERFNDGRLTKIKNGGLTFVIQEEIEAQMKVEPLGAIETGPKEKKSKK